MVYYFSSSTALALEYGKLNDPKYTQTTKENLKNIKKRELLEALFTTNLLIFGRETGSMEYDFLRAIYKINNQLKWFVIALGDV